MPTIREVVNFFGLHGNAISAGPGAGCALRASTATCGATAPLGSAPLDALSTEIGFTPPSLRGLDSVDAIRPLSDGRRIEGREPPGAPAPVSLGFADLSNTPTPKGDHGPMGARRGPMRRMRTSARHPGEKDGVRPLDRAAARLQNTVYSISYAKRSACGVDHCSRRRGGGCTCGDAKSGLVSARALRAGSGCREPSRPWGGSRGGLVLTARGNRTGGADQGSAT